MDKLTLTFANEIDEKIKHMESGLKAITSPNISIQVSLGQTYFHTRLTEEQLSFIQEYTTISIRKNLIELKKDFDNLTPPIVEYGDDN